MKTSAIVRLLGFSALNSVGIVLYLVFAVPCWIEPELADVPGASGGAADVWGLTALPVLAGFVVINAGWLLAELAAVVTKKTWRFSVPLLRIPLVVVPVAWALAVLLDFSHHGI